MYIKKEKKKKKRNKRSATEMTEEESTFSSLAEETEIDRCRDYVVTKAAFIRKKKRKKYLICIFLYDMLSFYRFYFFFLNLKSVRACEGKKKQLRALKETPTDFPVRRFQNGIQELLK